MRIILVIIIAFVVNSCHRRLPLDTSIKHYSTEGNPALVIVSENNNSLGGGLLEIGFESYRDDAQIILADVFGVTSSELDDLSLNQIIDQFGEDWQINEIIKIASASYNKIISLTDDHASGFALLDNLEYLKDGGYDIDLIFNLHGSSESIWFSDQSYNIVDFTSQLVEKDICIRSLYQTCCFGSDMIDEWEEIDIMAVNGAFENNSLAMFSPIFFIENWLNGFTFDEAVQLAYQMEIDKIKSYNSVLPIMQYLINDEIIEESKQITGGIDRNLLWIYFPLIGQETVSQFNF